MKRATLIFGLASLLFSTSLWGAEVIVTNVTRSANSESIFYDDEVLGTTNHNTATRLLSIAQIRDKIAEGTNVFTGSNFFASLGAAAVTTKGGGGIGVVKVENTGTNAILLNGTNGNVSAISYSPGSAIAKSTRLYSSGAIFGITNDNTEQTLYSFTVPANALGTTNSILIDAFGAFYNNNASVTYVISIKYGNTTMWSDTTASAANTGVARAWTHRIRLAAAGSTSLQYMGGWIAPASAQPATVGIGDLSAATTMPSASVAGTATEDSTTDLTFTVTVTLGAASSSLWICSYHSQAILE